MRKALLLSPLLALLSILNVWSQTSVKNINVDNARFTYKDRAQPRKYFYPQSFYFQPQFTMPRSVRMFVSDRELVDRVNIPHQRITHDKNTAEMLVDIEINPIEITGNKIERRFDRIINKRDTTYIRYYWLEISYTTEAKAVARNAKTREIVSQYGIFNRKQTKFFKSREYPTQRDAEDYWMNNQDILREQITREEAFKTIDVLNGMMENDYSFLITSKSSLIKTINEKSHPENNTLRGMSDNLKQILSLQDGNVLLQKSDLMPFINYFEAIPARYTSQSKPDVRLRYVAYYNLCRIYLFLERPDEVKPWADRLHKNGFDVKDRDRLIGDADKLRKELFVNGVQVRSKQFYPDDFFRDLH